MRYIRIFLLNFQKHLELRSRMIVWFLVTLFSPLLMILFWKGAINKQVLSNGWSFSLITSYYFLVIVAGAFLMCHIEEDVAQLDIQEGNLTPYLLKPFSYFWMKFFDELPYRVMHAFFGIIVFTILLFFFRSLFTFSNSLLVIILSFFIFLFAYFLSFTFKMIIGILAFWLIEIRGLFEVIEVMITIFAGYLMPIALLPHGVGAIAYILPFSYMIYFPIIVFEGKLSAIELFPILAMQSVWLFILYLLYKKLWHAGLKKYSAVGQ